MSGKGPQGRLDSGLFLIPVDDNPFCPGTPSYKYGGFDATLLLLCPRGQTFPYQGKRCRSSQSLERSHDLWITGLGWLWYNYKRLKLYSTVEDFFGTLFSGHADFLRTLFYQFFIKLAFESQFFGQCFGPSFWP